MSSLPNRQLLYEKRIPEWREKPHVFVTDMWPDTKPEECQETALCALALNRKCAWSSGHGCGKTSTAAWAVLWFMACFPMARVITLAPSWRQIKKIMWPEIHKWYNKSKWFWPRFVMLETEIRQRNNPHEWFGLGIATDQPYKLEGFHALHVLLVCEEAKGIELKHWESIQGAMTTNAWRFEISTGCGRQQYFAGAFDGKRKGFFKFRTSSDDSPRVTPEWIEDAKSLWGEGTPVYRMRVHGEIVDDEEDQLIPLSWFDAATQWPGQPPVGAMVEAGLDVARFGEAENVLAIRKGDWITELVCWRGLDTVENGDKAYVEGSKRGVERYKVDVIGLGAGTLDQLRRLGATTYGVNSSLPAQKPDVQSGKTKPDEDFVLTIRDAMWWKLRKRFENTAKKRPGGIWVPNDDVLRNQITSIKQKYRNGKILVESKEESGGRGWDRGDAVAMAFWEGKVEGPRGAMVQLPMDLMAR